MNKKTEKQKAEEVAVVIADNIAKQVAKDGIKALPTGARVAMANSLKDAEFSMRRIAKVLSVDNKTAMTYLDTKVEDKFLQYSTAIKRHLEDKNDTLRSMTAQAIKDKLQDADKQTLRDLAGLYKITNDVAVQQTGQTGHSGTSIQILNVHPALNRKNNDK